MAKYTIELRTIVESGHNIFNFSYSFYSEAKRSEFQQHFIDHFYLKEIGQETVGRFEHYLKVKFHEVLPYYNMLFETALINYNKTQNYNLTETLSRSNTSNNNTSGNVNSSGSNSQSGTSNLSSNTNNTTDIEFSRDQTINDTNSSSKTSERNTDLKNVESDTPQGLLAMDNIENNVYASKVDISDNYENVHDTDNATALRRDNNSETTNTQAQDIVTANSSENSNGSSNNNTTNSQSTVITDNENYTKNMCGSYGVITEADMLQKHIDLQKTLSTIEQKFFAECEELFMLVY